MFHVGFVLEVNLEWTIKFDVDTYSHRVSVALILLLTALLSALNQEEAESGMH